MTESDIKKIEPYFPVIEDCVRGGINDYYSLERRSIFEACSRASIIRDYIVDRAKKALCDDSHCRFIELNRRFMIQIHGINIQFKKLGKDLRSSYIATQQAIRYISQTPLFGTAPKSVNLIAGYILGVSSGASRVYLVQPSLLKRNSWEIELGDREDLSFMDELTVTTPPIIPQPKLKLKENLRKVQNE